MKHIKVSQHLVDGSKSYLFDTNVWLRIFNPMSGVQFTQRQIYLGLFNDIQVKRASVYVTSLILSEYINSALRMGFNEWKASVQGLSSNAQGNVTLDFKRDYRRTPEYSKRLKEVVAKVKQILRLTIKHPDEFESIDIDNLLGMMEQQSCDYNDAYLVKCCEEGSMILVSDDQDVKSIASSVCLVSAR